MHRRFIMWIVNCWRLVMDNRYNPLKYIPDPSLQMYFTLILFTMWSVYFGFVASYYMGWLGYSIPTSIIVHMAVLIPVGFTNAVFLDAERDGSLWLRKWQEDERKRKLFPRKKNMVSWDIDKEA
tara:strand:+ start:2131 stop:2502 length:372 start_codon:yes stop_codon:yes gene_type:complete